MPRDFFSGGAGGGAAPTDNALLIVLQLEQTPEVGYVLRCRGM